MNMYSEPGDEAIEIDASTLGWEADNQVIALARDDRDNTCGRAILLGFHESLAKAIASMNPQVQGQILLSIRHEVGKYNQAHDSCSQNHQPLVERIVQEWAEELDDRVTHHVQHS